MTIANTEMVHVAWCYSNYIHNRQTTNADFFSLFAVNDILDQAKKMIGKVVGSWREEWLDGMISGEPAA